MMYPSVEWNLTHGLPWNLAQQQQQQQQQQNPLEPKAPAAENYQNSKVPVLLAVRSASQTAPWCQR